MPGTIEDIDMPGSQEPLPRLTFCWLPRKFCYY